MFYKAEVFTTSGSTERTFCFIYGRIMTSEIEEQACIDFRAKELSPQNVIGGDNGNYESRLPDLPPFAFLTDSPYLDGVVFRAESFTVPSING